MVKLKDVIIYINGKPTGQDRGLSVGTGSSSSFDKTIEKEVDLINGLNELKIVAVNERDEATTDIRRVNVSLPVVASADRTDYGLIIATNDYDEWDDLTNPVFDANTIAQELSDHYGFKVEKLLNPTTGQIISKLREYSKRTYLPNDQLFIFIAGHGQFDAEIVFADLFDVEGRITRRSVQARSLVHQARDAVKADERAIKGVQFVRSHVRVLSKRHTRRSHQELICRLFPSPKAAGWPAVRPQLGAAQQGRWGFETVVQDPVLGAAF